MPLVEAAGLQAQAVVPVAEVALQASAAAAAQVVEVALQDSAA